ncbi:hypothetical protein [Alteromonas macleodii]|uniref:Uncharacterized protein n=1 Tax=Alteromonas macleodii TaxID=28108 RepID=A0AB36FMN4_ALTMA|nr:hypothetical protein [Alteromonas macleodii]OES24487.1 hypothetical protein BFV95_4754 [Alteromonas macleodii]OES25544.1 hypothetical protein BFV94_4397 [Alteromonas macleodii]OES25845.1 hypothetical protein BFV93_4308 [Alteromonas macleodii]OES38633.1 hypothetical protein BFV96_4744 [Alteromonas macleodii]
MNSTLNVFLFIAIVILTGEWFFPKTAKAGDIADESIVTASANSIACYGTQAGYCLDEHGHSLAYDDFISQAIGQPGKTTRVTYFEQRDDKVILEYETAVQLYKRQFLNTLLYDLAARSIFFSSTDAFWSDKVNELKQGCPIPDGCYELEDAIAAIRQNR